MWDKRKEEDVGKEGGGSKLCQTRQDQEPNSATRIQETSNSRQRRADTSQWTNSRTPQTADTKGEWEGGGGGEGVRGRGRVKPLYANRNMAQDSSSDVQSQQT
jgi:hypothetical protein